MTGGGGRGGFLDCAIVVPFSLYSVKPEGEKKKAMHDDMYNEQFYATFNRLTLGQSQG